MSVETIEFPNKEEATLYLTDEVAKKLGYDNVESLSECYNGFGSFILEYFVDFDDNFFENSTEIIEFAENYKDEKDRVKGGRALLSRLTIAEGGTSKGEGQYPGTIFDTGHILAYMLIGNVKDFNSRKNYTENIFPQTSWSNGGGNDYKSFKLDSNRGNSQLTYENRIRNKIKKRGNEGLKVYYQVDLIYTENDEVPRGIHIQAVSNDKKTKLNKNNSNLNVFIPNVRYQKYLDIDYSKIESNRMKFDFKFR